MECDDTPPQSVFNTKSRNMVQFLEGERGIQLLYAHQVESVLRLREYFDNQQNKDPALVVLPTGCGKTGVAVLASYALNATRVLVITPSIIISRQISAAYSRFLIERGIITDTPENRQNVLPSVSCIKNTAEIPEGMKSVVMVVNAHKIGGQSRVKIEDIPRKGYDLVIVDEAHHYPAPTWRRLVDYFSGSRRLFLTATPWPITEPPVCRLCYELVREDAVEKGIIRKVEFDDKIEGVTDEELYSVSYCIHFTY